jgi:F-type H+-transporting ATPase subunit a
VGQKAEIGVHSTWQWPIVGSVHADTIMTTWVAMFVTLLFLAWIGRSYRKPEADRTQTVFEGVITYISDLIYGTLGKEGEPFVPFFIALFIYLFVLNQFGVFQLKTLGLPFGGSPSADLNTTVPYAAFIFCMIWFVAIRKQGVRALKHLLEPFPVLLPINLLEQLARPVTLAARLFFNIFVGEILLFIIASLIASAVKIGPFDLSLAVAILPFFIQFFNFFVGTVQAFIFTLLGIVYLSLTISEEH